MSRKIRRVPLDFDWPLNKVWSGFLLPAQLEEDRCPHCKNGYSPEGQYLYDLWYGYVPFTPEDNGSTPLSFDTPAVWKFAEKNVFRAPEYYGGSHEYFIHREAERLARLWNGMWSHHLNDLDVAALVEANRLVDFTHTWSKEKGWQKIEPPVVPSTAVVNLWSLQGFGHDSINAGVAVEARCKREGAEPVCGTCEGHASIEAFPGQRADAEAWEPQEPPVGEGWQIWETVSEGSPISPVMASREALIAWMTEHYVPVMRTSPMSRAEATAFVDAGGTAFSMVFTSERGLQGGEEAVLSMAEDRAVAAAQQITSEAAEAQETSRKEPGGTASSD